ncbi:hypothetical protein O181_052278 [Austropuccinia psidii MF-1]|uniref:Uncharacterized protein n=1 Tax=Austropuccinia psidii MF-1 TaxID=1389203 RepID=A0A9Q3E573_9BASI|nr:hypothetical protein [Austropuccinia psidii MF-1]
MALTPSATSIQASQNTLPNNSSPASANAATSTDPLASCLSVGSSSPWPAWSMSGLLLAALPTASRLSRIVCPTGLPPTWQVTPLAMVFGLSGYITSVGDHYNGSGTASAWSCIYLFMYGKSSWKHTFSAPPQIKRSFLPLALSTAAFANGIMHGYVYWSGFYGDSAKPQAKDTTENSLQTKY